VAEAVVSQGQTIGVQARTGPVTLEHQRRLEPVDRLLEAADAQECRSEDVLPLALAVRDVSRSPSYEIGRIDRRVRGVSSIGTENWSRFVIRRVFPGLRGWNRAVLPRISPELDV
jgi:hypothetical protein